MEDPITLERWGELNPATFLYQLPDCGHTFTLDFLDKHMSIPNNHHDGHLSIEPKRCPVCRIFVRSSFRYGDIVKPQLIDLENLKKKFAQQRLELSEAYKRKEKEDILKAMEKDLGANSSGKWFKCPNGHPYAIGDCGGANQISKCICGAQIGGTQHRLLPNNSFARDWSGGSSTAWPTMEHNQEE